VDDFPNLKISPGSNSKKLRSFVYESNLTPYDRDSLFGFEQALGAAEKPFDIFSRPASHQSKPRSVPIPLPPPEMLAFGGSLEDPFDSISFTRPASASASQQSKPKPVCIPFPDMFAFGGSLADPFDSVSFSRPTSSEQAKPKPAAIPLPKMLAFEQSLGAAEDPFNMSFTICSFQPAQSESFARLPLPTLRTDISSTEGVQFNIGQAAAKPASKPNRGSARARKLSALAAANRLAFSSMPTG
jgi:hypothetical protein